MQDIFKRISVTLKNLRHEHGWSLDKTAQETGVSKAMLGQIERKESSPPIRVFRSTDQTTWCCCFLRGAVVNDSGKGRDTTVM